MFYLWLVFQVLIQTVLYPLKLFVNLLVLIFNKMPFKVDRNHFKSTLDSVDIKYGKALRAVNSNLHNVVNSSDSPLYVGLLFLATKDPSHLNYIRGYLRSGTFARRFDSSIPNKNAFSGDMAAGYFSALLVAHENEMLNVEDYRKIKDAVYNTVFKYPYFTIENEQHKTKWNSRGLLLRFFSMGDHYLISQLFLACFAKILDDRKLKFLYNLFKWFSYPLTGMCESSVWSKFFYMDNAFDDQTHMNAACYGYYITKDKWFKRCAKYLYKKHGWYNPEITGLYNKFIESIDMSLVELNLKDFSLDNRQEGKVDRPLVEDYQRIYNLKRREYRFINKYVFPPSQRFQVYTWARMIPEAKKIRPRPNEFIDYIYLYSLQ